MYLYSYLIANIVMLLIWLVLFLFRRDVRREMLFLSFVVGICGLLTEPLYTVDWWRPLTITNTRVGIEDFLFGFWIGGISAVIYEEVFKKKIYIRKTKRRGHISYILFLFIGLGTIFYASFYMLKLNSFYSSVVALVPLILFVWIKRNDLIIDSLATGLLVPLLGLLWFWIPEYLTPGWIEKYWLLNNLSGITLMKAPLEDLIWGFLVGAYVGPLYEFWKGARLVTYRK